MRLLVCIALAAVVACGYAGHVKDSDALHASFKEAVKTALRASGGSSRPHDFLMNAARSLHTSFGSVPMPEPWSPLPGEYYGFVPPFVGVSPLTLSSRCNRSITFSNTTMSDGVSVTIHASSGGPLLCEDMFLVGDMSDMALVSLFGAGSKTVTLSNKDAPMGAQQWLDLNGVRIFAFRSGLVDVIGDIVKTISLFVPSETEGPKLSPAAANLTNNFLASYAGFSFEHRSGGLTDIDPDSIPSGSILAVLRMDGLAGLEMWATGARTDHIVMAFRWSNGTLMIVESTDTTAYWTRPNIQMHTWEEWLPLAQAADFNVAILPLAPAMESRFNSSAAEAFIEATVGGPYGYHNFLWGFVDTPSDNWPYPVTWEFLEFAFSWVERLDSAIGAEMWGLAMNKRLGTSNMTTVQGSVLAAARNPPLNYGELMALPEQDKWVYPNGLSMVCDVYACEILKHGGIFDVDFQCTEMQNGDFYSLDIFDLKSPRPKACQEADPAVPYCMLMGDWLLELPGVNTVTPYANMDEKCPSLPPKYARPTGC